MTNLLNNTPYYYDCRVKKWSYLCVAFLLFDIFCVGIWAAISADFRSFVVAFSALFIVYFLAIFAGLFAVMDRAVLPFYPLLGFNVGFLFGGFLVVLCVILQSVICLSFKGDSFLPVQIPYPSVECNDGIDKESGKTLLKSGIVAIALIFEKAMEFLAIRKIMLLFESSAQITATTRTIHNYGSSCPSTSYDPPEMIKEIKESDEDLIVYENETKPFDKHWRSKSSSLPSKAETDSLSRADILPIKSKSKMSIE